MIMRAAFSPVLVSALQRFKAALYYATMAPVMRKQRHAEDYFRCKLIDISLTFDIDSFTTFPPLYAGQPALAHIKFCIIGAKLAYVISTRGIYAADV